VIEVAASLTKTDWEDAIAARVRATMASADMERYFNVKMTKPRARVALLQLSLFVSCRRDCWANLIANCDAPALRQRLMEHEYDELVEDEYSSKGHYDLLIRQGALIGLSPDDFANAQPLRTSMATFYGWKWITRAGPWQDGLIAMMATEWVNDDRRLMDQGGGLSRRDGLRWIRDFGYQWGEMPNFAAHAVADEKHGDLFLPLLDKHVPTRESALKAADDALELFKLYHLGVAEEMERMDEIG
jgi:pyrroloquinoline quinone (PQQ) biosynthesis protein C